jgi:hypothetical protein
LTEALEQTNLNLNFVAFGTWDAEANALRTTKQTTGETLLTKKALIVQQLTND